MDWRRHRFTRERQRVKHAEVFIKRDGNWERLDDAYTNSLLKEDKAKMFAPWNVENLRIQSNGTIELQQFGKAYDRKDNSRGKRVPLEDEHAWRTTFTFEKRSQLTIGEMEKVVGGRRRTFIQLDFLYNGRPDGQDTTMTAPQEPTPQDLAEHDESRREKATQGVDDQAEGEHVEGGGSKGEEAIEEGHDEEKGEEEDEASRSEEAYHDEMLSDEEEGGIKEEIPSPPIPSLFPIAKLCSDDSFHGSNPLEVRLIFERVSSKNSSHDLQWWWPAACRFLAGHGDWAVMSKKDDTEREVELPLLDWVKRHGHAFPFTPGTFVQGSNLSPGLISYELKVNQYVVRRR